ncbi:MAG: hypothetical protein OEU44_00855 [Gammaproteobacteria bacterium]|nr:hypothetical protein [Gammaproteobacteria bacterium]
MRPGTVERLAWAMQEVEQRMEQLPRDRVSGRRAGAKVVAVATT